MLVSWHPPRWHGWILVVLFMRLRRTGPWPLSNTPTANRPRPPAFQDAPVWAKRLSKAWARCWTERSPGR
eukprot:6873885-Pyramimonas_sp.AAC.1